MYNHFQINNAGKRNTIDNTENIENIIMRSYVEVMDINVKAVIELSHYCIKHLIQTKGLFEY